jgi:RNA polymerase sigma factor (TIGR02999 family)
MQPANDLTALLWQWHRGDSSALGQLTPLVYDELHRRAKLAFRSEQPGHTLQPTALVHELYDVLRRVNVDWQNRGHFFSLCSRTMRRVLVDHAKSRKSLRRGGGLTVIMLHTGIVAETDPQEDLLSFDRAMEKLAKLDDRKAELVDLQVFGGLTFKEMEDVTGLSSSTLDRELRFARAWLKSELAYC